jgi:hypothetical protein
MDRDCGAKGIWPQATAQISDKKSRNYNQRSPLMYSQDELKSLHGFLRSTGEGNLKNMLVGGAMTEVHLRLLLKVVRAVKEEEFVTHFESSSFPKIKCSPAETALKEAFWKTCGDACSKVGLLSAKKAA